MSVLQDYLEDPDAVQDTPLDLQTRLKCLATLSVPVSLITGRVITGSFVLRPQIRSSGPY